MIRRLQPMFVIAVLSLVIATASYADDRDELTSMLHAFLAGVDKADVHDAFWADDLVYTSSSGSRTNKLEIMAGFENVAADDEPAPVYSAEDVSVEVYGDAAVVAFRLIARNPDSTTQEYFNTGTFLNRDDRWQVVAWQATRIPSE